MDNKTIQSLWVGGSLSPLEQMCIRSFLYHGHDFVLYSYEPIANVPEGVIVKDANEIIPLTTLHYSTFSRLCIFSDFFRYKLLLDKGGWWVDTDTFCMKPFDFPLGYVFSSEYTKDNKIHVNNGNIKAPAGSEIIKYCWEMCLSMRSKSGEWSASGPALMKSAVELFKMDKYVQPPKVLCPIPWWEARLFKDPTASLSVPNESHAIHLWNNMWSDYKMDKNDFPESSLYEVLLKRIERDLSDTTAIIKTIFRDKSLFHCVRTLKEQYPKIHILVADDGVCTNERKKKLEELGVDKYIELPWNVGLSAGRNALLEECKTPYLLLCDDDFSFTNNSHIERLRDLMEVSDIAAGCVFNVRNWTFCNTGSGWDLWGGNLLKEDNKVYITGLPGQFKSHKGIQYEVADLVLNFFVAKVESLKKVKWDENLQQAFEHVDFFLRAKHLGLKSVRSLNSYVLHKELDDVENSEYMKIRSAYGQYLKVFENKWGFKSLIVHPKHPLAKILLKDPLPVKEPSAPTTPPSPAPQPPISPTGAVRRASSPQQWGALQRQRIIDRRRFK